MSDESDRCIHCILPKSDSFAFNENGECSLCVASRSYDTENNNLSEADDLEEVILGVKERGKGRPYDCIVGVSGGRDSSFLLYLLVRKHNLRCIAAYYRTPFTSDTTDANVQRLVDHLRIKLVKLDISGEYHTSVARDIIHLWAKKPSLLLANMACAPCKLVNRELYALARMNGVKTIFYGGNKLEAVQLAPSILRDSNQTTEPTKVQLNFISQFKVSMNLAKKGLGMLKSSNMLYKYIPLGIQSSIMYLNPHTPYLRIRYSDIKAIDYFYMTDWNEKELESALLEVGWELPPGCNSTWRSDCSFAELKNCMFKKMTGITYMDAYLSNMVRAGIMTRDEAMRRIALEGKPSPQRIAEACDVLDLAEETIGLFG